MGEGVEMSDEAVDDADVRIGDFVLHQSPEGKLFLWRDGEGMEVEPKSFEAALAKFWGENF